MTRIIFGGVFILFCLLDVFPYIFSPVLGDDETVICRSCNLSVSFHGCLLDFGICITKPGQYCIKEDYRKGGINWFSVKGCTESHDECFKRTIKYYVAHSTHCCHHHFCNI